MPWRRDIRWRSEASSALPRTPPAVCGPARNQASWHAIRPLSHRAQVRGIRFIASDLAAVEGLDRAGAQDTDGEILPPDPWKRVEVVQKRNGKWRFIVTR
jgi:hypothetical protein